MYGNVFEYLEFVLYMTLTISMGKNFCKRHFDIVSLFVPENGLSYFIKVVFSEDNLHEMSKKRSVSHEMFFVQKLVNI